ncbi:hypothetical protein F4782DRAFT_529582 [Xylaria castorea]|nr:hypothetical protein F4782DRAFT_529582 [Xylaria castorea]
MADSSASMHWIRLASRVSEARFYFWPPSPKVPSPNDPIRLVSRVCSLTAYRYIYISSSGFNHNTTVTIFVDGKERKITEALAVILRVMSGGLRVAFWADGLYELAQTGLTHRYAELNLIIEHAYKTWCMLGSPRSAASAGKRIKISERLRISGSEALERIEKSTWVEIEAMFSSPYWSSVECIAELVLSRAVNLLWGAAGTDFESYIGAFRALTYLRYEKIPLKPSSATGGKMAVAMHMERPPNAKRITDIPTWVPDFSADAAQRGVQFPARTALQIWGDSFMRAYKRIRITDENHLIVQARGMDCMVRVSPVFNPWNAAQMCLHLYQNLPNPKNELRVFLVDRL